MKTVTVVQSSYIPWKGYFDLIGLADEFVVYDDVEFSRGTWRNRNRIKTPQGLRWLTIPIRYRGHSRARIDEIETSGTSWAADHWRALEASYGSAPHFETYRDAVEALYRDGEERSLSRINVRFLRALCALLGIRTPITLSTDYEATGTGTERLVGLLTQAGATRYVSGPAGRAYIDERAFERAGIALEWMDYAGYAEYPQPHPPFEHAVTVLDLLFSVGPRAPRYLKSFAPEPPPPRPAPGSR
ncbi:MAG TPA: WbqC family protein [Solirubrobacteraceae bacterium]|nr:WbqC family protein [Solirubrobacteraceae bacterium]